MKSLLSRLQDLAPVRFLKAYGQSKASNYAAGLAFNSFTSMFPLMLGILSIVGLALGGEHQHQVQTVLVSVFPADAQGSIRHTLESVKQHSGLLGIVAILGFVWTGTNYFGNMEFALSEMYGVEQRTFLRQRVMGVMMLVVFLVGMGAAIIVNSALGFIGAAFLGPLVGALVLVAMMTIVYRVVPNRSFHLNEVLVGAVLAGVLMEVVTLAFPLYARLMHGFNTYGATFALFLLLAAWLYFISQFMLMGAVLNRFRQGPPREEGVVADPGRQDDETRGSRAADEQRAAGART